MIFTTYFQMPLYVYILEKALDEGERLSINSSAFYSIKNCKEKFYSGAAPEYDKLSPIDKNALETEFLGYAKRFLFLLANKAFSLILSIKYFRLFLIRFYNCFLSITKGSFKTSFFLCEHYFGSLCFIFYLIH